MRSIAHMVLHVVAPALAAAVLFRFAWLHGWLLMMATMLVDLDHLLATPIFDPDRCSIGFHPLHSSAAITVYAILLCFPITRVIACGLLVHMGVDTLDCLMRR